MVVSGRLLRVVRIPESYEDYVDVEDPEGVIKTLKTKKPRADVFAFWQRLPETRPKYSYHMEWDNVAAIPVTTYNDWIEKAVHPSVRTKLRKAAKQGVNVQVVEFGDSLVQGMAEIFNETPIRQGRPYPYYGKRPDQIRAEWDVDMDMSVFVGAYFEGELVGFAKLSFTERYAEMSGTICKLAHRDKSVMSALIAKSVQFCEAKSIPYLTYGKFSYGKKGEDTLSDFKRYNGFQKIELPRYYVPLTLWGRMGLKLGLHHSFSQRLPQWLLKKLLEIRTKYYQRLT
jgi:hypothetical protein